MEDIQFEEMRSQIAILKGKLEKQSIINDRLLSDSMQNKVNDINKRARKIFRSGAMAIPAFVLVHYASHISWPVVISSIILIVCSMVATYLMHRKTLKRDFLNGNVADVAEALVKMKAQYKNWQTYSTPVIILWLGWYVYDFVKGMGYEGEMLMFMVFFCVGCGIYGYYMGTRMNKQTIEACDKVLSQLNNDAQETGNTNGVLRGKFNDIELHVRTIVTQGIFSIYVFNLLAFCAFKLSLPIAILAIALTGLATVATIILCRDMVNGNTLCQTGSKLRETVNNFRINLKTAMVINYAITFTLAGCIVYILDIIQPLPVALLATAFVILSLFAAYLNRTRYVKVKSLCGEVIEQLSSAC